MLVNLKKTTIKKSTTPFETYYTKQIQQRAKKHKIYTLFMYIYTCIYACKCKYIYIYMHTRQMCTLRTKNIHLYKEHFSRRHSWKVFDLRRSEEEDALASIQLSCFIYIYVYMYIYIYISTYFCLYIYIYVCIYIYIMYDYAESQSLYIYILIHSYMYCHF